VIGNPPPFALATPTFRFRALASHAGRAALGGDREIALACLVAGRLGAGLTNAQPSAPSDLKARAVAAKQWLASLVLPAALRTLLNAAIESSGDGDEVATARALSQLLPLAAQQLDEFSLAELRDLVNELQNSRSVEGA